MLRLVFTGNETLSSSSLEKEVERELEDFFESDFPEAKGDDAAFLIENLYRKTGYHFVHVEYRLKTEKNGTSLEFIVSEGPQVQVRGITVSGNTFFADDELLSFFAGNTEGILGFGGSVFVESEIRDAISSIHSLYTSEGFLKVDIGKPVYTFIEDQSQVKIHISINEEIRILIGKIDYKGEILENAQEELEDLSRKLSGKPFLRRLKLILQSGVREIYGNLGYPDVSITIDEVSHPDSPQVDLSCSISSGSRVTIASIEVTGNERTDTGFIIKRLALKPGELYTFKKRRESFRKLYQTGLFSRVTISLEKTAAPEKRQVKVMLEEALSREIFLYGGWGSYELLRGSAGYQDKNIFGLGRIFRFEGGGSLKSGYVEATVRDPYILGTDITADFPVFYRSREEPSFTREEYGGSVLFSKRLSRDLSASLRYQYSRARTKDISADTVIEQENDYTIASLKAQTTLDNRDDVLFPTSGYRMFGSAEVAEPALGSNLSYYRFNFGIRSFIALSEKNILAMRYDTGVILPGRNQVIIPIGERYFNGGENKVRSFRESELGPKDSSGDPLGGNAFNVFSIEIRRLLTDNLVATIFVDYGNISPNFSPEEENIDTSIDRQDVIDRTFDDYFSDFRPAVGFGLQYLLPVGPARLDFAWNPDQDKERDEDSFNFHFSIGMAF
jgi:outer membrane protein assembly complex protein YaeT